LFTTFGLEAERKWSEVIRLRHDRDACIGLEGRVPAVYLASANAQGFAVLPVRRINNIRAFNIAFSSIPTAPTNNFLLLV
jgi:hypothetical protein